MEHPLTRRHPPTATPPSPRLVRSRSGAENYSNSFINSSQRFNHISRSKSTTRSSRNLLQTEENVVIINPSTTTPTNPSCKRNSSSSKQKKFTEDNVVSSGSSGDGFVRFLQRGSPRNSATTKRPKAESGRSSPSAWALSPGRRPLLNVVPPPAVESSPGNGGERKRVKAKSSGGGGGGVGGVLKYFRLKKVSPVQEEEYHRYRVLHNRLLQWRFANARAEAAMASLQVIAEDKLFHVWVRMMNMRNLILEKQLETQRLKQEMKTWKIMSPQMKFLKEWAKLGGRNCEAVGSVTRKLSALSIRLPLVDDAKGDVEAIYEAMNKAVNIMNSIETTIAKFLSQVEKILYLITELTSTLQHQKESLEDMKKVVTLVAKLLAWERSVRVHLLQVALES